MRILKTHKRIEIDKTFGNIRIQSVRYAAPIKNSDKFENYTVVSCWYNCDCENCPMAWEDRNYEGECGDCGCLFDYNFNVPIWKCMLPNGIKRKIIEHYNKKRRSICFEYKEIDSKTRE